MKTVTEGDVELEVPDVEMPEDGEVFYNPVMEWDRNISVSAASFVHDLIDREEEEITGCDLLSASGVRALRYKEETGMEDVTANDISEEAVELIEGNAERNSIDLSVRNENANMLLRKERYSFIDIDPFGSPIKFLDSAAFAIPFRGVMAATATDTGALVGAFPEASRRRYGLSALDTAYSKELGARVLLTAIMKRCFPHEKTFWPLFAYTRQHYFRVWGVVRYGTKHVNRTLREMGYISHCFECGWRDAELEKECPLCGSSTQFMGEVYLGEIQDSDFCEKVSDDLMDRGFVQEAKFMEEIGAELPFPLHYDTHYLAAVLDLSPPPLEDIREALREEGYRFSRTHFSDTGFKTQADFGEVKRILEELD